MAASKKPRKRSGKHWNRGGVLLKMQPWKVRAVLGPLESILDQLEQDGTVTTSESGTPMFKDDSDGKWYATVPALNGVIEAYAIHERRNGRDLNLEPLHKLASKRDYGIPIFESDTAEARGALHRMWSESVMMTVDYAAELVKDFQIKDELEKIQAREAA